MPPFDREHARAQLERFRSASLGTSGIAVSVGEHVGRLVGVKPARDRHGRPLTIASFEIIGGQQAGAIVTTPVWGHAERLVTATPVLGDRRFVLAVYAHDDGTGREQRRVNIEAIRLLDDQPNLVEASRAIDQPARDAACGHASEFTECFVCVGGAKGRRRIANWESTFAAMARNDDHRYSGQIVFLSTFTFTAALAEHQAANDSADKARGEKPRGSLEGYAGPCFAPLLTFDIDCRDANGAPDPASCQQAAVRLVDALVALGITPEAIGVYFSGSKGFHITIPSALAGATPRPDFHLVAKAFCLLVAELAGVSIDESLYVVLQPLRAPNSRHGTSGLYKIWLSPAEVASLPFEHILDMARQPRVFEPPECECEPASRVVALWRQAIEVAQHVPAAVATKRRDENGSARISHGTWDYLLNGAPVGQRAESHFKAASNLADFDSVDELVHALMARPAALSGLPAGEAEGHVASALRRAALRTPPAAGAAVRPEEINGGASAEADCDDC